MTADFEWKELPNKLFKELLSLGIARIDGFEILTGFIFNLANQGRDFLDHDFDEETGEGLDTDDEHLLEVFSKNGFTFLLEEDGDKVDILIPGRFSKNEVCRTNRKKLAADLRCIIASYS
jgi:hypothetical protein